MEERLINAQELAYRIGRSVQTLNAYYKFKDENPDNEYSLMLPEFIRQGNHRTRYWKESDIGKIIRFIDSLPKGRDGVLGPVTQRYSGKKSEKSGAEKSEKITEQKKRAKRPGAYIYQIMAILEGNDVEPDFIEFMTKELKEEFECRRNIAVA